MDKKESIIELQNIDCNCNDCIFMQRNANAFSECLDRHYKWQKDYHEILKAKLVEKGKYYRDKKNDLEMYDKLLTEADKMKFQFNKNEAGINYGTCDKLHKSVSFIPNTCQIETQKCFKHRRGVFIDLK